MSVYVTDSAGGGSNWFDGLGFYATDGIDKATASSGAGDIESSNSSGPSGAFVMSREEMENLLQRCRRVRNDARQMYDQSQLMQRVQPPAQDPASLEFNPAAEKAGRYYVGHMDIWQERMSDLIDKLEQALGITTEHDEQVAQELSQKKGMLE